MSDHVLMAGGKTPTGMKLQGSKEAFFRLQQGIISLEKRRFDILEDDRFVTGLAEYLFGLYQSRYFDFTHTILNILGESSVYGSSLYREKVLFVLSLFTERVLQDDNEQLIQALSLIFSKWLRIEQEYLSCFEHVCRQIQTLLNIMPERGMQGHLAPWLQLFNDITSGKLCRLAAIQAVVGKMEKTLKQHIIHNEYDSLQGLTSAEDVCVVASRDYSEKEKETLVLELYASEDMKRRLVIIEILSQLDDEIAYTLIENLTADSPWYTIRNAVHIISRLGNTEHFALIQPFLGYPDVRVQQQMMTFIVKLESAAAIEQLLLALEICDDSLKFQIIPLLSATGSKAAEMIFLRLLDVSGDFEPTCRDELILLLCTELCHFPTIRVVKYLQGLIAEREIIEMYNDPIIARASRTIELLSSS